MLRAFTLAVWQNVILRSSIRNMQYTFNVLQRMFKHKLLNFEQFTRKVNKYPIIFIQIFNYLKDNLTYRA